MVLSPGWAWAGRLLIVGTALIVVGPAPDLLGGRPPSERAGIALAIGGFLLLWAWFWLRALTSWSRLAGPLAVAALAAVLLLLTLAAPPGQDELRFAVAAAGAAFPWRRGVAVVAALSLLAGVLQLGRVEPPLAAAAIVAYDLTIGLAAAGGRLLLATGRQLQEARAEIARLGQHEERLDMLRDRLDAVGQNLTAAVLKGEQVARELPRGAAERMRQELRDLVAALRLSLDDVRDVAAGYRHSGMDAELADARAALDAAGIDLSVEDTLGAIPRAQEAVLAWAVREGLTNVLSHRQARTCIVRLAREDERAVLRLWDDGTGERGGLAGISERVSAAGGSFEASGQGGGFQLRIALPLAPL